MFTTYLLDNAKTKALAAASEQQRLDAQREAAETARLQELVRDQGDE